MKATYKQIEKAINNTFDFEADGTQELYNDIRSCEQKAISNIGTQIGKTSHHFTRSDWNKVYSEIKNHIQ